MDFESGQAPSSFTCPTPYTLSPVSCALLKCLLLRVRIHRVRVLGGFRVFRVSGFELCGALFMTLNPN